jgi:hypothetical protein
MAYKTFVWVGGSTASTSADRFNFNIAQNWRERIEATDPSGILQYIYRITTQVPGPGDKVYIGTDPGDNGSYTVTSPLLFGGFSGDVNGGTWATNSSGGGYGTTWSSALDAVNIGTDTLNNASIGAPNTQNSSGAYKFNYPFPVIGGGITQSVISTLKACTVGGFTPTFWDFILDNRTTQQERGLVLKTDELVVGNLQYQGGAQTVWNSNITSQDYIDNAIPGISGNFVWIKLKLVDNYGYNPNIPNIESVKNNNRHIVTSCVFTVYNTLIEILDSAFFNVNIFPTHYSETKIPGQNPLYVEKYHTGVSFKFHNCVIENMAGRSQGLYDLSLKDSIYRNIYIDLRNDVYLGANIPLPVPGIMKLEAEGNGKKVATRMHGVSADAYTTSSQLKVNKFSDNVLSSTSGANFSLPTVILGAGLSAGLSGDTITLMEIERESGLPESKNWLSSYDKFMIEPGANVHQIQLQGRSSISASAAVPQNSTININTITLNSNSAFSLHGLNRNVWKIGVISGVSLFGGINMSDNGKIFGSSSTRLLNYSRELGKNIRGGNITDISNTPPISELN